MSEMSETSEMSEMSEGIKGKLSDIILAHNHYAMN